MSTAQALRAYAKAQIENWPAPENAVATVCRGSLCSDDVPIVEGPPAVGTPPLIPFLKLFISGARRLSEGLVQSLRRL